MGTILSLHLAPVEPFNFDEIYRGYLGFVKRELVKRNAPLEAVDDLAQEVFLELWKTREKYRPTATMARWLGVLCQSKIYWYYQDRQEQTSECLLGIQDPKPNIEHKLLRRDTKFEQLTQAMSEVKGLPLGPKRAKYLLWISEISWEEWV